MTALVLKNPFTALASELPSLRAFALLMTNDEASADRAVVYMTKRALRDQSQSRSAVNSRTPLFVIMRNYLLRRYRGYDAGYRPQLPAISNGWIAGALMHLSFLDREAVILTVSMGFSDEETGTICECAPELVRQRRSKGLTTLANLFDASGTIPSLTFPSEDSLIVQ